MDESLIAAARRGNRDAQASVLRALQDPWYRLCLSLLRNEELALDATQESALRFLRQLPGFRGQSQLRTWAMGIAINVVREMRRARRPMMALADDGGDEIEIADADAPAPEDAASMTEERAALEAVLADLPDRQREAVVLRFLEELSTEETAAAMECATGTVKATLHQALRTLRKKLHMLVL